MLNMNENQKPFVCPIEECKMTFTNEDHLNWHQKKHDMVLNLGLANKNAEASDQTPTPTRFIRNCEEVGLFQDLQNVNPFDETFKKAIEAGKTGSLHVPEPTSNNDDTLHTPHIFPHVESSGVINTRNDNQSSHSSDFCISSVHSIQENHESENYDLTIVTEDASRDNRKIKSIDLKSKLKETIKNKEKSTLIITPVPLAKLKETEVQKRSQTCENNSSNKKRKTDKNVDSDKVQIMREMNRVAQLRCRKRKRMQQQGMEEELKMLRSDNTKLNNENQCFKHKIYALKELCLKEKSSFPAENILLKKIEEILNAPYITNVYTLAGKASSLTSTGRPKQIPNEIPITPKVNVSKTPAEPPPAVPVAIFQNPGQEAQNPVVIKVMGPVKQLAVSVLPSK